MDLLSEQKPLTIVDIGASGGIQRRWEQYGRAVNAILFEPDPREYDRLSEALPKNYTLYNTALYDHKGKIAFNLCRKQMCSSVLESNVEELKKYHEGERFDIVDRIELPVDTLDNVLSDYPDAIDFVKIDAEAAELFILKGATNVLSNTIGLEIETAFFSIRKNQPLFHDINKFMQDKGFQLIDLRCDYWKRRVDGLPIDARKGQLIWGDALYFKLPEKIIEESRGNEDTLRRAFLIYLAYGYVDLAASLIALAKSENIFSQDLLDTMQRHLNKVAGVLLPEFKGKGCIYHWLYKLTALFRPRWWGAGGHHYLGN